MSIIIARTYISQQKKITSMKRIQQQAFIIEKEINTSTNTLPENRSPNNNNLVSTEGYQSNPDATTTVIKINVPRRAIGK